MDGKHSLVRKAARFSFFAPVAITALWLVLSPLTSSSFSARMIFGVASALGISIALVMSGYALLAMKKVGREGILIFAVCGLILNVVLIGSAVQTAKKNRSLPRVPMLSVDQMRAMPPVIDQGTTIIDRDFGFRIELPGGFVENPQGKTMQNVIHAFILPATKAHQVVVINRLGMMIPPDIKADALLEQQQRQLPPGSQVTPFRAHWQNHAIPGVEVNLQNAQLILEVQVPLTGEAIQLNIGGPLEQEAALRQLLEQTLASLKARSNWDAADVTDE